MRELALHLLDLAENSVAARATKIQIMVDENHQNDRLHLSVIDDGIGMDAKTAASVIDPFFTTRTTRKVGLGLPLLKEAAETANGFLKIASRPGEGTRIDAEFQYSHIDRMPLGDLPTTWLTLLIGSPDIHWFFSYRLNAAKFEFDNDILKQELGDIPLTDPTVLGFLREYLAKGVAELQPDLVIQ